MYNDPESKVPIFSSFRWTWDKEIIAHHCMIPSEWECSAIVLIDHIKLYPDTAIFIRSGKLLYTFTTHSKVVPCMSMQQTQTVIISTVRNTIDTSSIDEQFLSNSVNIILLLINLVSYTRLLYLVTNCRSMAKSIFPVTCYF